jgi:hypothetical protein
MRFHACTHRKTLFQSSRQNIVFPPKPPIMAYGVSMGEKNESWNFQEWFAQECFSAHGELEYDVSSDFFFGPASVRIAHGPPPIRALGPKFKSLIFSFFHFFLNFFIKFKIYIKVIYNNCKFDHIYSYNNKIYLTTIIKKLKKK